MALHNYFSELMAMKGMEDALLVRDDARITLDPKFLATPKKRRSSRPRHPTFRPAGCCPSLPNRPSRKRSHDDLPSVLLSGSSRWSGSKLCDTKMSTSSRSLELFYAEVAPNRRKPKSLPKPDPSDSNFDILDSICIAEE